MTGLLKLDPPLRERVRFTGAVRSSAHIAEDRALMARTFAYLYGAGTVMLLTTLMLPGSPDRSELGLLGVALVAVSVVVTCLGGYDRLPFWFFRALPLFGNFCIGACIYFGGAQATGAYALYFFWVGVSAYYFFDAAWGTLCAGVASALYAILIHVHPDTSLGVLHWMMLTGTLFVIAVLVGLLRSRAEGLVERLADAARTDVLTGLANRRDFDRRLAQEVSLAERTEGDLALVFFDIDRFKQINDRHGHHAGDLVLRRVAEIVETKVREQDTFARFGGDEFALLVPGADRAEAYLLTERLREAVARVFEDDPRPTTLSAGIALFGRHGSTAEDLTESADKALYAAKRLGRNCAVIYSREVARSLVELGIEAAHRELPTSLEALISVAEVVDVRQLGSSHHSQEVGRLAGLVAARLGYGQDDVQRIRLAGILHDIGKIGIPGTILAKPGPLNDREREEVRRHPEIGAQIARNASLDDIADWIVAHHERPDGDGYPLGLRGDDVPMEARILAVADAYEAMTAGRGERPPLDPIAAAVELRAHAGSQFDRRVVEVLLEALAEDENPAPPSYSPESSELSATK